MQVEGNMPNQKEHFRVRGTLRGQGRERQCWVEGWKVSKTVDELTTPTDGDVIYDGLKIADDDDFPDGDYEVTFDGQTTPLTRKRKYLARRKAKGAAGNG
jgi:hypothetical protein